VTLIPTDYRAWRAEAAGRDRAFADGYRSGLADGRHHRERLVVLGTVGAVLLFGRRLGLHPLVGLAVALAVVVALWPVLLVVLVVELTVRQHRLHGSWPRTAAYVLVWLVGIGLVLLAVTHLSAAPLVVLAVLVGAWTFGPRALAWWRRHHRGPGRPPGGGDMRPGWPPPAFSDADRTLGGAGDRGRPESLPVPRDLHVEARAPGDPALPRRSHAHRRHPDRRGRRMTP
jgi:hypothetical protein